MIKASAVLEKIINPVQKRSRRNLTVVEAGRLGEVNRASSYLLYTIACVTVGIMLWAYFTQIETIAHSQGKVIPSSKLQVVQNLEGGIVSSIHVKPGQNVKEGDLLVSLNETQFEGDYQSRSQQLLSLGARMARLNAESQNRPLQFEGQLVKQGPEFVSIERSAYQSRQDQLRAQLETLQAQVDQKRQELQENKIALKTATSTLELGQDERDILSKMVAKGLEPKLELVRLDRTLAEAQGRKETAAASIKKLESAIIEMQSRKDSVNLQFMSDARAEANKAIGEYRALQATMPAYADKKGRTEIRAPLSGIVNRVLVSTVGGVVKPGEPIAEVVPANDQPVFESHVSPTDIGFIKVGQVARIKLSAYDYSIFGAMTGTVTQIGADAVSNEKGESYFIAKVETEAPVLESRGKKLQIMPGMQAQVDIVTGKRTVWEYLSKPIIAVKENAFRER
jgi:adhesin transport system membrane fusion protein